jgi:hypothetical protein
VKGKCKNGRMEKVKKANNWRVRKIICKNISIGKVKKTPRIGGSENQMQ